MKHFQPKTTIFSRIFLFLWVIICVVISISLMKSLVKVFSANDRVRALETQQQTLEINNTHLQKEIEEARSPFMQEKMIRDELSLQLPGEVVVQLSDPPSPSPFSSTQDSSAKKVSFIAKFFGLFFKK